MSFLAPEFDRYVPPPPIFVVGMPRSGTTLLSRLLETSGPYIALPESHFFARFFWTSVPRRRLPDLVKAWRRFSRKLAWPLAEIADVDWSNIEDLPESDRYRHLFLGWVKAEQRKAGCEDWQRGWIENSPPHTEAMEVIRFLFPDARIVGIVRDPRAVQASLNEVGWNNAHPAANAMRWRLYAQMLCARRHSEPGLTEVIRFEDLVANPVPVLSELGRWLDIPLRTEEIEASREFPSHGFDSKAEPWKALATKPPDRSRIHGWRERLSAVEKSCLEAWCRDEMNALGYEANGPNTSRPRPGIPQAVLMYLRIKLLAAANRVRITSWRL